MWHIFISELDKYIFIWDENSHPIRFQLTGFVSYLLSEVQQVTAWNRDFVVEFIVIKKKILRIFFFFGLFGHPEYGIQLS